MITPTILTFGEDCEHAHIIDIRNYTNTGISSEVINVILVPQGLGDVIYEGDIIIWFGCVTVVSKFFRSVDLPSRQMKIPLEGSYIISKFSYWPLASAILVSSKVSSY